MAHEEGPPSCVFFSPDTESYMDQDGKRFHAKTLLELTVRRAKCVPSMTQLPARLLRQRN